MTATDIAEQNPSTVWSPDPLILPRVPHLPTRRPARLAFPVRFAQLSRLAHQPSAQLANGDHPVPAIAWNLAALMASDEGDHELAQDLCMRHYDLQQRQLCAGEADAFTLGLQPLINLVRLANNTGRHEHALEQLTLVHAYARGATGLQLAGRDLKQPADLPERVREQATVLLAGVAATDGIRARIGAERWTDLVGDPALESREPGDVAHQVHTMATLVGAPLPSRASALQHRWCPPDGDTLQPWTRCVLVLLKHAANAAGVPCPLRYPSPDGTADAPYNQLSWATGTEVAHTRLAIDLLRFGAFTDAATVRDDLLGRTLRSPDAYVCRDLLYDKELLDMDAATRHALQYLVDTAAHTQTQPLRDVLLGALDENLPDTANVVAASAPKLATQT
jgi:hypothetical protein